MFGKKDKQDGDEKVKPEKPAKVKAEKAPKVKAEKAAKPKKSKGASAKSGPNFLVAHVEKLVLGLVVAAAGYFVFAGLTTEGYPTARAPEVLAKDAGSVLTQISDDHWEAIAPEREIAHNFDELAKKARRPTDPTLYPIDVLDPKPGGTIEKRGDPKVLPPQQLVANSFVGAIAVEVKSETPDPYEAFEDADKIEVRGNNSRRPQRGARGAGSDGAEMGYGMGGASGEPGGPTPIATIRRLSAEYDLGAAIGAMAGGMGPGMPGGGMPDMGSGGGMPGMPGMPGAGGTRPRDGLGDPNKDRRPKTKIASQAAVFVAATALVPHKQMVEEYDRLFKNSGDYIVARDRPAYLSFEVQRVDVTQDPNREIKEDEWKIVTDGTGQMAIRKNWAILPPLGRPVPEVIDRNAVQNGLTMPIPPVLLRDYREICKHPAIDWAWNAKMLITPRKEPTRKPEFDDGALPGELGGAAGGQPGAMGSGMDMYGGGGGMDMYGSGGGMDMYGSGGGMDMYGGGGGMDMYGSGGGMDMYGSGGGMDMYGSGGGMGMGMDMYGGGGGGPPNAPQPEYKMLRFYDMLTPKDIGKTFRYRARLIMRDPNYPERNFRSPERDAVPAPPPNSLLPEVFDRVAKLRKQDDAAFKKDPKARRTMLQTDWSEASPPVRIEGNVEVFAGVGYDSKPIPVAAAVLPDGTANLVTTKLDNHGARLAKNFTEVRRGTVLNQTKEENLDFVVPLTKVIKKRLMKPPYASNVVVVDMRGGEELAASNRREDPLATSGEVMVLLQDGSVQITSDLDDTFEYRMYTFADEYEKAEGGGASSAGSAGGGDSPMMSGP